MLICFKTSQHLLTGHFLIIKIIIIIFGQITLTKYDTTDYYSVLTLQLCVRALVGFHEFLNKQIPIYVQLNYTHWPNLLHRIYRGIYELKISKVGSLSRSHCHVWLEMCWSNARPSFQKLKGQNASLHVLPGFVFSGRSEHLFKITYMEVPNHLSNPGGKRTFFYVSC